MTRRDFMYKWLLYTLALLIVLVVGLYILPWIPIFGIVPTLLPVAAIVVAVLEGPVAGAGFGLFVGILSDALVPGLPGAMTLGLSLFSLAAGAIARYGVRQDLVGCLLCSAGGLILIDLVRIFIFALEGKGSLSSLIAIAAPEIFWSLVFTPLVYLIFRWVHRRVPQASSL